ncbi:uncharacterized protein BXZ73DRAFT_14376, partial [Epithele typhae]|uniref:uncharacterized protein n=1 Tax=Epithele typhae TaxID=378194 RepID=UPI002007AAE0
LEELFSRLNSAPVLTSPSAAPASRTPFDFGDRTTFVPAPPSELLARVQAFLPELAAANVDLLRRAREDPGSVDIESLEPSQHGYIEMNLGLGVFEQR